MRFSRASLLAVLMSAVVHPVQAEDIMLQFKAAACVMDAIKKDEYVAPPSKNKNIGLEVDVNQTPSGKLRMKVNGKKLSKADYAKFSACALG